MKHRIVMWGSAGFLIACFWAVYSLMAAPISAEPLVWTLAQISCPIVFAGNYFHSGISIYFVFLSNVVTYAVVGLIMETLRRQLTPAN
jgi:hypothetical protein